jgi:hypothetical protein
VFFVVQKKNVKHETSSEGSVESEPFQFASREAKISNNVR